MARATDRAQNEGSETNLGRVFLTSCATSIYCGDMVFGIATRYVSTLLGRSSVVDYLDANQPEMLSEFRSIVAAVSVEGQPGRQADAAAKEAR
ncbi:MULTISPECIES: hypothetical protein [unclassified Bradyrhizobium]|uniref:hypothetical protein n=1 Tax=unclassified Bradyrhizobium TaxID=2631580 RepID=UPI003182DC01